MTSSATALRCLSSRHCRGGVHFFRFGQPMTHNSRHDQAQELQEPGGGAAGEGEGGGAVTGASERDRETSGGRSVEEAAGKVKARRRAGLPGSSTGYRISRVFRSSVERSRGSDRSRP